MLLDREQILVGLNDLADELRLRGERAHLFLVGGAAMAVAYNTRRSTRDVGLLAAPGDTVLDAAKAVADRRGWSHDWLEDGARVFKPALQDPEAVLIETDSLHVAVGSPRFVLAMKLFAARDKDRDDVDVLLPLAGVRTAAAARALVYEAYAEWFEKAQRHKKSLFRRQARQRQQIIDGFITDVFPSGKAPGTGSGTRAKLGAHGTAVSNRTGRSDRHQPESTSPGSRSVAPSRCGRVVASTGLPCLLKPGHKGRCRSR